MDRRFLITSLAIDAFGLTIFSILYQDAIYASTLSSTATSAANAVLALEVSAALGTIAAAIGFADRSGVDYKTAGALALASLVLGLYVLIVVIRYSIQNGDNLAACGGYPPGYWTNTGFNRCTAWIALREDWAVTLLLAFLATSAVIFWASILALVHRIIRSNGRNDGGATGKTAPPVRESVLTSSFS